MTQGTDSEYAGPERRRAENSWRVSVEDRLALGEETMRRLEEGLGANTKLTERIAHNTEGIVIFTTNLEAGAKLLCRIALGISWTLKTLRENLAVVIVLLLAIGYFCNSEKLLDLCLKVLKAL